MARAAIDLGSNSVLLAIVGDDGAILHDEARVVGLGRGLGDRGAFDPVRMDATASALRDYAATAERLGVSAGSIRAVATSSARRATNAEAFFERVRRECGLGFRTISGDEEARLTWLGALRDLDVPDGPLLVVDLGGGSTELVLGTDRDPGRAEVKVRVSLEIGSVRLTERFLCPAGASSPERIDTEALARVAEHVDHALAPVRLEPAPATVVGVAGSVTTLAATLLGLRRYDGARVHGAVVDRAALARLVARLAAADAAERRALVPTAPDRADWLPAAGVILDRILAAADASRLVASDRGLRFGVLADADGGSAIGYAAPSERA
jgi:exopolyphosphatase/guanosine-5'-triphosphate,3'-diphosphate pyrophosphatase